MDKQNPTVPQPVLTKPAPIEPHPTSKPNWKKMILMLIAVFLLLIIAGFSYILGTNSQKQETSPPTPSPYPTVITPTPDSTESNLDCTSDSDCGINICSCTVARKDAIKPEDKICARTCTGTPKCANNKCTIDTIEGKFCGGFAKLECPTGYGCYMERKMPDASGICVKQ